MNGGRLLVRRLSASCYDGNIDPAVRFFAPLVQRALRSLTRPDPDRVFRKRVYGDAKLLDTPQYKYLTDSQLEAETVKAAAQADRFLQMPPVVRVHREDERIISRDPGILGHDAARYVFTDITYGLKASERVLVVREPDGTLKHADYDLKKRLIQTYFPMPGQQIKEPLMFSDESFFSKVLERKEYEFILDRACSQYNPEEITFQKINSRVFQHCDSTASYEVLRSTRHFGPMAFYFTWNNIIDGLLLELLQHGVIREATVLISLRSCIRPDLVANDETKSLLDELLKHTNIWGKCKPSQLTDSDISLDEDCFTCIEKYIGKDSTKKAAQELALQSTREIYKQKIETERGIKSAHGNL